MVFDGGKFDSPEHHTSFFCYDKAIKRNEVTETQTEKVGTTGGCNKSYYLLTMNLLEPHQS